jgi:hypothetical protein
MVAMAITLKTQSNSAILAPQQLSCCFFTVFANSSSSCEVLKILDNGHLRFNAVMERQLVEQAKPSEVSSKKAAAAAAAPQVESREKQRPKRQAKIPRSETLTKYRRCYYHKCIGPRDCCNPRRS